VSTVAKQHYFFKLIPPRPTFTEDMTEEERRLMDEHGRYFQEHFAAGRVLLFGPVMATDGAFGLGVLEVDDEAEARRFGEGDPSVRAGLNRFELYPMRVSAARAKGSTGKNLRYVIQAHAASLRLLPELQSQIDCSR
jgi:uncharacterized protein